MNLTPLREAKWVPQRPATYDSHLDEVMDVRLGTKPIAHMTRWQMFLVGCGIQPDLWDAVNRRYIPRT